MEQERLRERSKTDRRNGARHTEDTEQERDKYNGGEAPKI